MRIPPSGGVILGCGGTIKYEYDGENRLVKKGDVVYTNDKDGNTWHTTRGVDITYFLSRRKK